MIGKCSEDGDEDNGKEVVVVGILYDVRPEVQGPWRLKSKPTEIGWRTREKVKAEKHEALHPTITRVLL